jgi:hypothetical protein
MSASAQVCSIPELVQIIIEHLEFDRTTLYSAHLVNTTWAKYASKVLWRNAPLSSIATLDPSPQQQHANLIQTSFTWGDWVPAELKLLSFPSLERCIFDLGHIGRVTGYHRILPPFFNASPQYLSMWLKCIGEDDDDSPLDRRPWEDCNSFYINAPNLRSFVTARPEPEDTLTQTLEYLASHKIFTELHFAHLWYTLEFVQSLLSSRSERPIFPDLKHFGTYIADQTADTLLALVPSTLSSLFLMVPSLDGVFLQNVTQFRMLQSLSIMAINSAFSMSSILPLGKLHNLHTLVIEQVPTCHPWQLGWLETYDAPFTDTDFNTMTSGLPLLHTLELNIPCKLSLPALTSLATNCPLLQTCHLDTLIPIKSWGAQDKPDFPNLDTLILTHGEYGDVWGGTIVETQWSTPSSDVVYRPTLKLIDESDVDALHVDFILRHCPKLSKLHLHLQDYDAEGLEKVRTRVRREGDMVG